ncbi:MAG: hypothetical protein E7593_02760 [Ruminococcaceae bacterium]|nr:hypothetical protein [Oscillospiraceae bacterium]
MKSVCIVSLDKVFSRMLELELGEIPLSVKVINEKLSSGALNISCSSDLVVFDADYYGGDLDFVEKSQSAFVVISNSAHPFIRNVKEYFERPFIVSEFVECIKGILCSEENDTIVQLSPVSENTYVMELDPFLKQAKIGEEIIKFSPKEFSLLSLLCKNRGRVVSRKEVLDAVWGEDYDESNNVDNVYINYLRNKLDSHLGVKMIYTVRGKGYMIK